MSGLQKNMVKQKIRNILRNFIFMRILPNKILSNKNFAKHSASSITLSLKKMAFLCLLALCITLNISVKNVNAEDVKTGNYKPFSVPVTTGTVPFDAPDNTNTTQEEFYKKLDALSGDNSGSKTLENKPSEPQTEATPEQPAKAGGYNVIEVPEKQIKFVYNKEMCEAAKTKISAEIPNHKNCFKDEDCKVFNFGYPWQDSACVKAIISTTYTEKDKIIQLLNKMDGYQKSCIDNVASEKKKFEEFEKTLKNTACPSVPLLCLKGVCRTSTYAVIESDENNYKMRIEENNQ